MPEIQRIKGADKVLAKVPDIQRVRKHIIIIIITSLVFGLSTMSIINFIPSWFSDPLFVQIIDPVAPIAGVILVEYLGFVFMGTMWTKRRAFQEKFKDRAYQHNLLYMFAGVSFEFTVITRIFLPVLSFENVGQVFANSWLSYIPGWMPIVAIIQIVVGMSFFTIGMMLFYRSVVTFGLDYLFYLYLYYPEESQIQHHGIYSVIRHPTYLSFILMCVGGAIFQFSMYSFTFCAIVIIRWVYHVNFVEEKELIQRFGESYKQYKQTVPAFVVAPKSFRKFFRFLLGTFI